jgi:hypothetical protein
MNAHLGSRARLGQHIGRGIEPDHLRVRIAGDQKLGGIARPATQIDDALGPRQRDLCDEIARRPRALILEFQVLICAPVGHRGNSRGSNLMI